jgi:hypothetical protein
MYISLQRHAHNVPVSFTFVHWFYYLYDTFTASDKLLCNHLTNLWNHFCGATNYLWQEEDEMHILSDILRVCMSMPQYQNNIQDILNCLTRLPWACETHTEIRCGLTDADILHGLNHKIHIIKWDRKITIKCNYKTMWKKVYMAYFRPCIHLQMLRKT